jgi:hypothetical protein
MPLSAGRGFGPVGIPSAARRDLHAVLRPRSPSRCPSTRSPLSRTRVVRWTEFASSSRRAPGTEPTKDPCLHHGPSRYSPSAVQLSRLVISSSEPFEGRWPVGWPPPARWFSPNGGLSSQRRPTAPLGATPAPLLPKIELRAVELNITRMEWSGPIRVAEPPAAPDVQGRLGAFAQQLRERHEAVAQLWQVRDGERGSARASRRLVDGVPTARREVRGWRPRPAGRIARSLPSVRTWSSPPLMSSTAAAVPHRGCKTDNPRTSTPMTDPLCASDPAARSCSPFSR